MRIKSSFKLNTCNQHSIRRNLIEIRSLIFQKSNENVLKPDKQPKQPQKIKIDQAPSSPNVLSNKFSKYFSPNIKNRNKINFRLTLKKKQIESTIQEKCNCSFIEQKIDSLPKNRKRRVTQGSLTKQVQQKQNQLKTCKKSNLNLSLQSIITKKQMNRTVNYNKFISILNNSSISHFQNQIFQSQKIMKFVKNLGAGTYGEVKLAESQNNKYAIKIYDKFKIFSKAKKIRIYEQIRILNKIQKHPNIITLIQAYQNKNQINLIFQYIESCLSLEKYLQIKNGIFSQKQIKKIMFKIAKGVAHIHSFGIVHRDLKPSNIIIGFDQDGQMIVKIIDFGLATDNLNFNYLCGTPNFISPELISRNNSANIISCDIWALGIIFYYLSQRAYPFTGNNQIQLYRSILRGKFQFVHTSSTKLQNLIIKMLDPDPLTRISCQQILKDQYFYSS